METLSPAYSLSLLHSHGSLQPQSCASLGRPSNAQSSPGMPEVLWASCGPGLGIGEVRDQQCPPTSLPVAHRQDSCSCLGQGQELPGEMDRHVTPSPSSPGTVLRNA